MTNLYYLGPSGTYSEIVAKKASKYLNNPILKPISTIAKVIDIVDNDPASFAILPIENSIEGIVRQTIDNIYLTELKIQAQFEEPINHCLISKGKKSSIKHIISHPQALSQCQQYILQNFDENIDLIDTSSTANAAELLSKNDDTYCAIVSENLAAQLPYNIIDKNISDVKDNITRFILISKTSLNLEGKNRTSIAFNTKNEPGALLKILYLINIYGLNLIYLESRPSKKVYGDYNFFADIDKGYDEIKDALKDISSKCDFYNLLGSYPTLAL